MNRTIVITGATGVLGNLVAKTFAKRGHNLVLLGKDQSKLDALARDLDLPAERLYIQAIDLLNGEAVHASAEAVHSKFGSVHALIHLVGGWTGGRTIPESSAEDLETMLNQHVWTTFHLLQSFTPHIAKSKWGRVIIVSKPETIHPSAKTALYTAAKSAQESLVLTLAEEYKESGLTANIIHVKSIDTTYTGKGTSPAEIVSTMEYLFSDEAGKVNGARIPLYA
ncbi:SDR family oxidoreductase [Candidatus Villigracilis saccharophilus]|uniref:SDR family NAD(P)-dependent oxidoreductase n=1 Tax=Candidatus Villigracilis saccharophilus TaxID=3140684 RepID=UPI003135B2FB|nr:SDR family oxidoreductase [Anaerolineales bacterium]